MEVQNKNSKFSYRKNFLILSFTITVRLIIHYFNILCNICTPHVNKDISGQTALVTGGGNGLGKEICIQLAKKGCNVVVVDIDINAAIAVAKNIQADFKIKSKAYKVDVSNHEEVSKCSKEIEKEMGPIDILVNNAGLMPVAGIENVESAELDRVLGVNVKSHFLMTQAFIDGMKMRNKGHIVAISSLAALAPVDKSIIYTTTKYAVKGFMDALNAQLILEKSHVKCSTVFPYYIMTSDALMEHLTQSGALKRLPLPPLKPSHVAIRIVEGILKDTEYIIVPKRFAMWLQILKRIPTSIWITALYEDINFARHKVHFEKSD